MKLSRYLIVIVAIFFVLAWVSVRKPTNASQMSERSIRILHDEIARTGELPEAMKSIYKNADQCVEKMTTETQWKQW